MNRNVPQRALSVMAGYDAALLRSLSPSAQQELELMSAAWCWAALVLSAPLAYAAWLLTHRAWLGLSIGVGGLLMLMQIVRLTVAGAGLSAFASVQSVRGYRPAWTPILWFALLSAMFAQPAQLPLWQREHGTLVAGERSKLLAVHRRALVALVPNPSAASTESYERELADNEFLVLRLCALWSSPQRAARYTLLYLAIAMVPLVLAQLCGRRALCRYQRLRVQTVRSTVAADSRRAQRRVDAALACYSAYSGRALDASRADTLPLRTPWPVNGGDREASS